MNRFFAAINELKTWMQIYNLGPFELIIRFRDPKDRYIAADCLARDFDPSMQSMQVPSCAGQVMGVQFKLEHQGVNSPHEVAEALRALAAEVDQAGRPIPLPPLPSTLTKAFRAKGDVCGPFNPDDTTRDL